LKKDDVLVGVGVTEAVLKGVTILVPINVAVRDGVGVLVAVFVDVGVESGVNDGVEDAIRCWIKGIISADSGQLSSQDWISVSSIFSMVGKIFGSAEMIFCPEVNATLPAKFSYPQWPSRHMTVMTLVSGSTQTLI